MSVRDELCWHEWERIGTSQNTLEAEFECSITHKRLSIPNDGDMPSDNPNFTIQLTRMWLERLKLYGKFITRHMSYELELCGGRYEFDDIDDDSLIKHAGILQSDSLNLSAVIEFMKGKVK